MSYQRLLQWYLIPPCLPLSNIRYVSRVKWRNPEKGVSPFPTPRCSSYWKGSFLVALDYGRQLIYIYIERERKRMAATFFIEIHTDKYFSLPISLSLFLSFSLSLSISLSLSLSLPFSLFLSLSPSLFLSLPLSLSLSPSLSLSLSLSLTLFLSLPLSLSFSLPLPLTLFLSLSFSLSFPSLSLFLFPWCAAYQLGKGTFFLLSMMRNILIGLREILVHACYFDHRSI